MDISNSLDSKRRSKRHELFFAGDEVFLNFPFAIGSSLPLYKDFSSFPRIAAAGSRPKDELLFSELFVLRRRNLDLVLTDFLLSSSTTKDSTASSIPWVAATLNIRPCGLS